MIHAPRKVKEHVFNIIPCFEFMISPRIMEPHMITKPLVYNPALVFYVNEVGMKTWSG